MADNRSQREILASFRLYLLFWIVFARLRAMISELREIFITSDLWLIVLSSYSLIVSYLFQLLYHSIYSRHVLPFIVEVLSQINQFWNCEAKWPNNFVCTIFKHDLIGDSKNKYTIKALR